MNTLLVADIGGTYARFAIARSSEPDRPGIGHPAGGPMTIGPIWSTEVRSRNSAVEAIRDFLAVDSLGARIDGALLAVAGPVEGGRCRLTNAAWTIDEEEIAHAFSIPWVRIVNDLEAAYKMQKAGPNKPYYIRAYISLGDLGEEVACLHDRTLADVPANDASADGGIDRLLPFVGKEGDDLAVSLDVLHPGQDEHQDRGEDHRPQAGGRGPADDEVVRRKIRMAGLWVNGPEVAFQGVPEFYAVFSSRPLADVVTPELAEIHQIGAEHLGFHASTERPAEEIDDFRAALIRAKQRQGLYVLDAARLAAQPVIDGGVYAATQGPRLETAAEVDRLEVGRDDDRHHTGDVEHRSGERVDVAGVGAFGLEVVLRCVLGAAGEERHRADRQDRQRPPTTGTGHIPEGSHGRFTPVHVRAQQS